MHMKINDHAISEGMLCLEQPTLDFRTLEILHCVQIGKNSRYIRAPRSAILFKPTTMKQFRSAARSIGSGPIQSAPIPQRIERVSFELELAPTLYPSASSSRRRNCNLGSDAPLGRSRYGRIRHRHRRDLTSRVAGCCGGLHRKMRDQV